MNIDLLDARSLFEKMMNHFGWYKTQMSELKVDRLEVDYRFIIEVPEELKNAINQEQDRESSKRKYTQRASSRKAPASSSSNRLVRKTSSRKEG